MSENTPPCVGTYMWWSVFFPSTSALVVDAVTCTVNTFDSSCPIRKLELPTAGMFPPPYAENPKAIDALCADADS